MRINEHFKNLNTDAFSISSDKIMKDRFSYDKKLEEFNVLPENCENLDKGGVESALQELDLESDFLEEKGYKHVDEQSGLYVKYYKEDDGKLYREFVRLDKDKDSGNYILISSKAEIGEDGKADTSKLLQSEAYTIKKNE